MVFEKTEGHIQNIEASKGWINKKNNVYYFLTGHFPLVCALVNLQTCINKQT
jgi:hypothetical protein